VITQAFTHVCHTGIACEHILVKVWSGKKNTDTDLLARALGTQLNTITYKWSMSTADIFGTDEKQSEFVKQQKERVKAMMAAEEEEHYIRHERHLNAVVACTLTYIEMTGPPCRWRWSTTTIMTTRYFFLCNALRGLTTWVVR
jgi:hypothetical protein